MTRCKIDIVLLLAVVALVITGLVFVYSASMYSAQKTYDNAYFFVTKQLFGAIVGFVALFVATKIPLEKLGKLYVVGVVIAVVLLVLVFIPGIGIENYGARRWIGFGGFSIQPSEIAKFAYVLFCSVYMSKVDMTRFSRTLPVVGVGALFCGLIITEPNMSITMCVAILMIVMLFLGGVKFKHLLAMLVPIAAAVPLLIVLEPYRLQRLLAFLDPWASPKDEGYQLIQSLYALGRGGWFGVGLFNSQQKYLFLPFAESDFIFSIIGEEIGLVGCLFVMVLYGIVIVRGVRIAINSKDKFRCFLAGGITAVVAIQVALNFAVVTGSIPPTGLPLPFISYGGTSLVVFLTAIGVLLNISKEQQSKLF